VNDLFGREPVVKALSIRQPWAWLILHAGKDIENRDWSPNNPGLAFRGRFLIHAGISIEPIDDDLRAFVKHISVLDVPDNLPRGGIVGQAEIVNAVRHSTSPWFFGPYGLVLANAEPLPFRACRGMLGFFHAR
jgi:hypothetical protein